MLRNSGIPSANIFFKKMLALGIPEFLTGSLKPRICAATRDNVRLFKPRNPPAQLSSAERTGGHATFGQR